MLVAEKLENMDSKTQNKIKSTSHLIPDITIINVFVVLALLTFFLFLCIRN